MKIVKILLLFSFFVNSLLAEIDNKDRIILENLYDNVLLIDSKKALEDIKSLDKEITSKNNHGIKLAFKELIKSWKSVEAFYLLGDINEEYIDTPRLMDIFHNGNEDITKQLDLALDSNDDTKIALFKNSLKSINALEYLLFTKDINNHRVFSFSKTIIKRLTTHFENIHNGYINNKSKFLSNIKKANSLAINKLIQSSYKLKEWRVGDVAGLTKKYKNKGSNIRAEYYLSKNSVIAIEAILNTYKRILHNQNFDDYGDYLFSMTDGKEMTKLINSLDKSLQIVSKISDNDLKNQKKLYDEINIIHTILFIDMIEDLQINAKILDADGD